MLRFNVGIALLKLVACSGVISLHFGGAGFLRKPAVPTFVFIGFYLSARLFSQWDFNRLLKRLYRLAVPFVAWGLLSLLCWGMTGNEVSLEMVSQQLLCGRTADVPAAHLYYLEVCIILTAVLYFVPRRRQDLLLVVLIVLLFVWQYSNLNYRVFNRLGYVAMNTFGRISELGTYACTGILFANFLPLVSRRKWFWWTCPVAFGLSCAVYVLQMIPTPSGFSYQGVSVFLLTVSLNAPVILLGEILMCREGVMSSGFVTRLKYVASLTSGMYYMHMLVGTAAVWILGLAHSFALAVIIFVVCAVLTAFARRFKWLYWLVA